MNSINSVECEKTILRAKACGHVLHSIAALSFLYVLFLVSPGVILYQLYVVAVLKCG